MAANSGAVGPGPARDIRPRRAAGTGTIGTGRPPGAVRGRLARGTGAASAASAPGPAPGPALAPRPNILPVDGSRHRLCVPHVWQFCLCLVFGRAEASLSRALPLPFPCEFPTSYETGRQERFAVRCQKSLCDKLGKRMYKHTHTHIHTYRPFQTHTHN